MINATPYSALAVPMLDATGTDVLVAMVKATLVVSPRGELSLAHEPSPIRLNDVQNDPAEDAPQLADPARAEDADRSVRYPSDLCVRKVGTDVIFVGHAVSPRPVEAMELALKVREVTASLRVHGPRLFYKGILGLTLGPAAPFERVPIVYERAYGGSTADLGLVESRNPVGRGVARSPSDLTDTPAPQIELPSKPYQAGARSEPAGWGAIPTHWSPRREYAGTYDEAWRRDRMPLLPADHDPRFANTASPALVMTEPLRPGDAVAALGVWDKGLFKLEIPNLDLHVRAHRDDGKKQVVQPVLDTLLLDPDLDRVELLYRCSFAMGRGPSLVREIRADVGEV